MTRPCELTMSDTKQADAIETIKNACGDIARGMMKITPAVPALQDQAVQEKVFETLYELTKNVETIKKQVGRIGKDDNATLL